MTDDNNDNDNNSDDDDDDDDDDDVLRSKRCYKAHACIYSRYKINNMFATYSKSWHNTYFSLHKFQLLNKTK